MVRTPTRMILIGLLALGAANLAASQAGLEDNAIEAASSDVRIIDRSPVSAAAPARRNLLCQ